MPIEFALDDSYLEVIESKNKCLEDCLNDFIEKMDKILTSFENFLRKRCWLKQMMKKWSKVPQSILCYLCSKKFN